MRPKAGTVAWNDLLKHWTYNPSPHKPIRQGPILLSLISVDVQHLKNLCFSFLFNLKLNYRALNYRDILFSFLCYRSWSPRSFAPHLCSSLSRASYSHHRSCVIPATYQEIHFNLIGQTGELRVAHTQYPIDAYQFLSHIKHGK